MQGTKKVISPAAINALKEALTHIYWTKNDLKSFVSYTVSNKGIVATIDWQGQKKYESACDLVDRMSGRPDLYRDDLFALFEAVLNFDDYSHLKRWDDAELKISRAKDSVKALRAHAKGYFQQMQERQQAEERKKKAQHRLSSTTAIKSKLDELNRQFQGIAINTNPQQRGYALEKLLNDLFNLFDLNSRASFKITGEQIDGSFSFDGEDYLLEAKWQKSLPNAGDLYKFAGKVNGKRKNTLGLFFSMDGFSQECTQVNSSDIRSLILMDGADLDAVLNDRISLDNLLYRKRRHASDTGNIYLSAYTVLAG
jgi:hypothetical protein